MSSALEQDGVTVRVRVLDNASGDQTSNVVAELSSADRDIEYVVHKSNIGAGANFDFGVRNLETEFFSILSDDDYLLPGFYRKAVAALDENPGAMFWVGTTLNVDPSGRIWDARVLRWGRDGIYTPPSGALEMTSGRAPAWTGILFRSEIIQARGFLDEKALGPSDLDFTLRLAATLSFIVDRSPVAVFSLNPDSYSATQPLESFWPGWKHMFKKFEEMEDIPINARQELVDALKNDGERMLFRRALNAIVFERYDFSRAAANALAKDCSAGLKSSVLLALTAICERVPASQKVLKSAYRLAEGRILDSRNDLQATYGNLLRPL